MRIDLASATLVGRLLLAVIFLMSGFNKIMNPQGTQQYMAAMGMTWATFLFYLGATALEVGGGLSVVLGYWTRLGAWALILFLVPTTLIFHTNFADPNQMIQFMKNLAMAGGLLYVAAFGPGRFSVDAQLGGRAETQPDFGGLYSETANQDLTGLFARQSWSVTFCHFRCTYTTMDTLPSV